MSDDQIELAASRRPKKGRSPSYPGISLREAEKRVRELYDAEKTHAAPVSAIVGHWGYSPTSSGGRTTLAALKKFGLLADEGASDERTGRLTELALELVLNPDPSQALREAALLPKFHRQMWDEYGASLPSAATLRYRLIKEFGFTESGAEEFVDEYRSTIDYAGLATDPESSADEERAPLTAQNPPGGQVAATRPPEVAPLPQTVPGSSAASMTIPIPLLGQDPVYVTGTFPLSEASWDQLLRVLEAMKPGLVEPPRRSETNLPPTASPAVPGEAEGGVRSQEYALGDG
jgi:hypothetical protein